MAAIFLLLQVEFDPTVTQTHSRPNVYTKVILLFSHIIAGLTDILLIVIILSNSSNCYILFLSNVFFSFSNPISNFLFSVAMFFRFEVKNCVNG